ncbi:MAG: hypothetical protein WBD31_04110 [Rubripirellula sp.]
MISDGRVPQGTHGLNGTFSANVKMHLYVGGERIELGQLGPGFAILRDAHLLPATEAEIETIVDQKVTRWPIRIISKITGDSKRFTFESV